MCYTIQSKQSFEFESMTITIEKNVDIEFLKVWITSDYDFLIPTHDAYGDFEPYQFSVPFGKVYSTRIRFKETIIKLLNCKLSDTEYLSEQQHLVNTFITRHFPACPIKCIPIQMKGFRYVNISKLTSIINCARFEDEICNGGPEVWAPLLANKSDWPKPCKMTTYKDSRLDLKAPQTLKVGKNRANLELKKNNIRRIEKEVLIYDTNDVIGAVGGSLGLFLGFSFFDVISKCLDNLIMPLANYIISSRVVGDQVMTLT